MQKFRGQHLLAVEALAAFFVQPSHGQSLEEERAVHQAPVNPEQQVQIERVVRQAGDLVHTVHGAVDLVDVFGRAQRLLLGAERQGVREPQRPLEPLPGISLIEPGFPGSRDHERVRCLHEQGPRPSEQHGGLAVNLPRHAVRAEEPRVAHVAAFARRPCPQ